MRFEAIVAFNAEMFDLELLIAYLKIKCLTFLFFNTSSFVYLFILQNLISNIEKQDFLFNIEENILKSLDGAIRVTIEGGRVGNKIYYEPYWILV